MRAADRKQRPDENSADHPLGVVRGEPQPPLGAARDPRDECLLGIGRVHDRQGVVGELIGPVATGVRRVIRLSVAEPVKGHDAEVPGEVGDLALPVPGMEQRPRRKQQDRRIALTVELVEQPLTIADDVSLLIGIAGARLFRAAFARLRRHHPVSHQLR